MSIVPTKWTPFASTNFTLQTMLPLILAVGALIGFPEDVTREVVIFIEAAIFTLIGFWGPIREFFKEGVKLRYNSNVLTYLFAFLGGLVTWLNNYDIEGVIGQLIDAFSTGNVNLILPAVFAMANIAYKLIQDKPWLDPKP